ncbi:hypothetical protein HNR31_002225 [Anoxybacillus caldiproteolyticus]|uniref:Uncharacterized protein n=1 Tax=Thermaerobacillus caldiproteolyticus TaxID=247480 RepID=A0A7V9Z7E5_9BACL|nr:hypothetical protein [Anoxybacillus caldiproteolyticus]
MGRRTTLDISIPSRHRGIDGKRFNWITNDNLGKANI